MSLKSKKVIWDYLKAEYEGDERDLMYASSKSYKRFQDAEDEIN